MSEVTERDLSVWSAYIGTALNLTAHDLGDGVKKALAKVQADIDAGKPDLAAVKSACERAVDACDLDEGTHPVIASKVEVVRLNLLAIIDQIGGTKAPKLTAVPDAAPAGVRQADGKVSCVCGKSHPKGSQILARHTKAG